MSHFNVAVFSHTPDEVDVLLEPFNEQVGFGSPYGVYEKYDENDTSGEQGRWYNPNARWDWYCVGGRWAGQLKLLEGKTGRYGSDYTPDEEGKLPKGRCDSAHVLDCDFSQDQEAYRKALRFWEVAVEGKPRTPEEKDACGLCFHFDGPADPIGLFAQGYPGDRNWAEWSGAGDSKRLSYDGQLCGRSAAGLLYRDGRGGLFPAVLLLCVCGVRLCSGRRVSAHN